MVQPAEVAVLIPGLSLLPLAAAITDCSGVIRWANAHYGELTLAAGGELAGQNAWVLAPEEAILELRRGLQIVIDSGESWTSDSVVQPTNGKLRSVEITITPVRDGAHSVTHALWLLREDSGGTSAARQLDQLQKIVSAAQLAARFGVFEWNAKTGRCQWSPEAFRLYGLDPDTTEASVDAWIETIHSDDRQRILREFQELLDGVNSDGRLNIEYRSADGLKWIAGNGQLYRDAEGQPDHMVGINIDITEHKRAELALSRQADLTQRIFNSTDAHLAVVDADGRILEVNEAWRRFAEENGAGDERNWGAGATYYRDCTPVVGDTLAADEAWQGLRQVQLGKLPHFEIEYSCHSPKERRWFAMRVVPFLERPGMVLVSHSNVTARQRVEEALRESEERYRTVSSVISDLAFGGWVTDGGEYINDWLTGATERITGYSADEIYAMRCWGALVLPEDRALFDKHVAGLAPASSSSCELRVCHKDGSVQWLDSSAECRLSPEVPHRRRIYGGLVDITQRKRVEGALLESERLLRESQIIAGLGSYVLPIPTGSWTSSDVLDQVFGIGETFERTVGGWLSLIHPEDREMMAHHFQTEVLGHGARFNKEYRIVRDDDQTERWVHGQGRLEFDVAGRPIRMLGTIQDITARKQADEALRESELRYRAIFESSRDALLIADAQSGMLVDANPAAQALTGRSLEELRTLHQTQLHPPEDALLARANFERDRTTPVVTLHRVLRSDGQHIPVEILGNPMRDIAGRELILGAFRDITERLRAEEERARLTEQLTQAQKMESVGRLAGGVAHDFNNLLTVINGHSQLLLMKLDPADPIRSSIEAILKAGERAEGLTRQLLAFSRKQVLQPRVLDLNRVVGEMRSMLARLVGEDVEVRVELDAKAAMVNADPHQLQQVIMNLVVNARDAMPGGGRLLIGTLVVEWDYRDTQSRTGARVGRYVMLSVTDSGSGMSEDTQRSIFEPFFTTKGVGKGTGLGLSMVHGIVTQSGGHIEVSSAPGCGTTFNIFLPQVADDGAISELQLAASPLGGKETVMVVEDQPEVLSFAVDVLTAYGYRVIQAGGASEGLLRFEQERGCVDLVLTDVVMPNGSGRDLADEMERLRPGIKVIFMSGYTDDVIVQHLVHNEGMHFLQKPFSPEHLAATVRAALGR